VLSFRSPLAARLTRTLLALAVLCSTAVVGAQTPGKTEILWLGQSAIRITTPGGKVILLDPFITHNPKTPAGWKNLSALGKIDVILVSHAHGDHVGDSFELAKTHNVPMWGPAGMNDTVAKLGILPANLAPRFGKGGTITPWGPSGPKITAVHAEHSSELTWKNPATGKDEVHVGGEPQGFIIQLENGFTIWHMGDTGVFGDMRLITQMYHPDLVLIPIGGHFVMSPADAAMVTREWIKPKFALPVHYGTIPQLAGTPAQFKAALGNSPVQMINIDPGQKVEF
jgi:L-ascorbate metabolism protein UlaG (beta-lactamase superfamily)